MRRKAVTEASGGQGAPGEFLYYWVPKEVDEHLEEGWNLDSAVSAQFKRISVGSRLWIVTCRTGRLHLAGPIPVARIMTPQETKKERSWEIPDGKLCAVPPPGKGAACRNIDIGTLASELRFESPLSRLQVLDGRVNPQQLQTLRRLTPDSARLLERRWAGSGSAARLQEDRGRTRR